ncbi:MAG: type IX secretion system protein PorQ [Salinivirgaceae bacterium]|nr:type IX secretion system protein PorQ [Salinivirgaceae bacterium]
MRWRLSTTGLVFRFCLSATTALLCLNATAQPVYEFAAIPASARVAALGGVPLAITEPDLGIAATNPTFLPYIENQKATVDFVDYIADISIGHASYCFQNSHVSGTMAVGIQYLNGGKNTRYDIYGNEAGSFSTNEYAFHLSYGRRFDSCFAIGATLKPILSNVAGYTSFGLLTDISASYTFNEGRTAASALLRNAGSQITAYDEHYGRVPFEALVSFSHQLEHAPFRLSLVLQQLQKPRLNADSKNSSEPGSEVEHDNITLPSLADNILRHCVFGLEAFPGKQFNVRVGFNYKRRQELKLKDAPGMAGMSLGFGLRLKRFCVEYAHARYTQAGASNHFSVALNVR